MKKILSVFIFTVLLFTLTGCTGANNSNLQPDNGDAKTQNSDDKKTDEKSASNDKKDEESTAPGQKSDQAGTTSTDDLNAYVEKLDPYIECINNQSQRIGQSYDRYLSWVEDADKGPTGNEKIVYGLYNIVLDPKNCIDGLKKNKDVKPKMETLEKAGENYAVALEKLQPILKEAVDYYDQEDYKDDAMAKGKEIHPKLMAAFNEFLDADDVVRNEVDKMEDERNVKELAVLEKEGPKKDYLSKAMLIEAKKLLKLGNVLELKEINLENFTAAVESYEKAAKAYEDEMIAQKEGSSSVVSESKNYLKAAKDLMRRVRDNEAFTDSEIQTLNMGFTVDGSPEKLVEEYNSLIQQANFDSRF